MSVAGGLHDCANALKLSLHLQFKDAEMLRDMYVGCQAARHSYDLVGQQLGAWIPTVLKLVPETDLPHRQTLAELWVTVGVEPHTVEIDANDLMLLWADGKLCVRRYSAGVQNVIAVLSGVLLSMWHFLTFTTSRWLSVGISCRCLARGWLTGLSSFMDFVAKTASDKSKLNGYVRSTSHIKQFAVQCGLAGSAPEGVQKELMVDAAVMMRIDELKQCATDELLFL